MKKGIVILIGVIIACVAAFYVFQSKEKTANTEQKEVKIKPLEGVEALDTPIKPNIEPDHLWKFTFDEEIDKKTIENQIYILNEQKEKVSVEVEVNNNEIVIRPPDDGYGKEKTYELIANNNIKMVDGKNIEPIHFFFITKRDEVSKVKYREDMIKIKKNQVESMEGITLVLKDLDLKGKIKKGMIILIETGDKDTPQVARKVLSVKEDRRKIAIDTEAPKFEELFDELDLYEEVPITAENIELDPIEGLTLTSVPTAYTASADSAKLYAEGKSKNSIFNFDNVKISLVGQEVAINGKMEFNKAYGIPDVQIKEKSISKFHIALEQKANTDMTVSVKTSLQEIKTKKKWEKWEKKKRLGKYKVPTSVPGLSLEGKIYIVLEGGFSGEPKWNIVFETESVVGVKSKGTNFQGYSDNDTNIKETKFYGEGKLSAEIKGVLEVSLNAYEVLSAGIEGQLGAYAETTGFANKNSTTTNPITCDKGEIGGVARGEIFIKAFPTIGSIFSKVTEYYFEERTKFAEVKFGKMEYNSCIIFQDLIPDQKEVLLKPGEEKEISLALKLVDNGTTKEETEKVGKEEMKYLSVTTKREDVVKAEVTKSGKIKLIAKELPSQQNTEIEVTYNNKKENRKKSITIPVKISDFSTTSLDQFTGYWRDENTKKLFVKIDKKSEKNIEFQAFDYVDIWYKGDVQFNAFKQNALSGKAKHLGGGEMDAPVEELKKAQDFTIEKISENKIKVRLGEGVNNLKRSSKKEFEKEQAAIYEGLSTPDTQPNQKPDAQSNQSKKVDGTYEGTATQSEPNVQTEATFKQIDDKTATLVSSQWALNSEGVTTKYRGEIQTTAVKQNDSTWTFTWKDNNDSKGTGTITFQGENATLDLKGDISNPLDMGTISTKTQLKKKS
ncbi:hypothetical protein bcgnr5378_07170 [Bacillus cereus]|uniref:SbsA Ig-like domain-containing protein n=1 Tax=Bacillus cereus TaxID=1396 RepID=A0A162P3H6_BACCE|nr:hypothetical protein [Bacillus cereus]KZD65971.1 hypothetical protein B4088_2728 [Bacillus cereus]